MITDDATFMPRAGCTKADFERILHMSEQLAKASDARMLVGPPMIIGICGPKGTGKDTTADNLMSWFYERSVEMNITWFADPLYEAVSILTGVPVHQLRDQAYKNATWTEETAPIKSLAGTSPRELLKDLGMWVRDEVSADHWAQHLLARTAKYRNPKYNDNKSWWMVPDLRFQNEAAICDICIEVRREGIEYAGDHPSEMRLPDDLIDTTFWLTRGIDYGVIGGTIMKLVRGE